MPLLYQRNGCGVRDGRGVAVGLGVAIVAVEVNVGVGDCVAVVVGVFVAGGGEAVIVGVGVKASIYSSADSIHSFDTTSDGNSSNLCKSFTADL